MAGEEVYNVRTVVEIDDSQVDPGLARANAKIAAFQRLQRKVQVGAAGATSTRVERQLQQQQRHVLTIQRMTSQADAAQFRAMQGRVRLQSQGVLLQRQQLALRQAEARAARASRPQGAQGGGVGTLGRVGIAAAGAFGAIQTARALAGAIARPIMLAAGVGESINKLDVLLGVSSVAVTRFADTAANSFGISRSAALDAAGGFAAMLRTAKIAPPVAADMSVSLVKLAADMASFNNVDPSEVLVKLRAGLAGESEPLRVLGVMLSENEVKMEAYRSGIAKTGRTLTEAQKVQARYSLIMRQTARQQGDVARTATALPNATRRAVALWENLREQAARVALPRATTGMNFVAQLLGSVAQAGSWSGLTTSFDTWWGNGGQRQVIERAGRIGTAIGDALRGFLVGAFGVAGQPAGTESVWVTAGRDAGGAFLRGFQEGFKPGEVAGAAGNAWKNNALPPGMGGNASPTSSAVTIGATAVVASSIAGRILNSRLARGIGWVGRAAGIGGGAAAGRAASSAGGAAVARGGVGLLIRGAARFAGPVGLALLAAELLSNPQVARAAGAAVGAAGHGHDVCECIRRAMAQLIPFLAPQGRFRPARPGQTSPVPSPSTGVAPPVVTDPMPEPLPPLQPQPQPQPQPGLMGRVQAAISKGMSYIGSNAFIGWCLKFIDDMFGATGARFGSAWEAAQTLTKRPGGTVGGSLQGVAAGNLAFLRADPSNKGAGHVMQSLGGGRFLDPSYKGVRITTPGDQVWKDANYEGLFYGSAPHGTKGGAPTGGVTGLGGGPIGGGVTIDTLTVNVQLSVDSLDDAQVEPFARRIGPAVAAEIVREVGPRLDNMPAGG